MVHITHRLPLHKNLSMNCTCNNCRHSHGFMTGYPCSICDEHDHWSPDYSSEEAKTAADNYYAMQDALGAGYLYPENPEDAKYIESVKQNFDKHCHG